MKFATLIFAIIMTFSAEAAATKVKSFSYSDHVKVKKINMRKPLPTNFTKLHRDFYFEETMIAKK